MSHTRLWDGLLSVIKETNTASFFACKALLGKLPFYLSFLLKLKCVRHHTRSQEFLTLETPQINTELGKLAFSLNVQNVWNNLQEVLMLGRYVSVDYFNCMLDYIVIVQCSCFV